MKNIIYVLLLIGIPVWAQNKVGVETDDPKFTLDVNGTMIVDDTSGKNDSAIPLAWDESTRQVVKASTLSLQEYGKPFSLIDYEISVMTINKNTVKGFDLGINSDKFVALLLQAYVTDDRVEGGRSPNTRVVSNKANPTAAYLQILAKQGEGGAFNATFANNGAIKGPNNSSIASSSYTSNGAMKLGVAIPTTSIRVDDHPDYKTYRFYGDFSGSDAVKTSNGGEERIITWHITVLAIKKEFINQN